MARLPFGAPVAPYTIYIEHSLHSSCIVVPARLSWDLSIATSPPSSALFWAPRSPIVAEKDQRSWSVG